MNYPQRISHSRRKPARSAFTLLETMIALTIFGVIMFALTLSLNAAGRAQKASQEREQSAAVVRAVFGALSRDIQAAIGSRGNKAAMFAAQGAGMQPGGSGGSLLMFTTRTHRLPEETLLIQSAAGASGGTGTADTSGVLPQSDVELVRYDLEPTKGILTRSAAPVPNLQMLAQPTFGPETTLALRVVNVELQFWDADQQNWRSEWNFQQSNQAQDASATGTAGATGQTPPQSPAQSGATSGDTALPGAVRVALTVLDEKDQPHTHTTMIPIVSPRLSTPIPAAPSAGQGAGSGQQGGGNGSQGQGGNQPGGQPGQPQ